MHTPPSSTAANELECLEMVAPTESEVEWVKKFNVGKRRGRGVQTTKKKTWGVFVYNSNKA